jgi:hypothetical protein
MSDDPDSVRRVKPAIRLAGISRLVALSLLFLSYVAYLCQEFPIPSTQEDLLKALRSDRPPVVEIGYDDDGVSLLWETAPLIYRELRTHVPGELGDHEVAAVEESIAVKVGKRTRDLVPR